MDFPKLGDTDFPHLENIDVWKYRNTFDYSRWDANVTIRLVSVPWNADYNDVVKFDNDAARNAWFDALEGDSITLQTMMRIKSDGTCKIPVPFDVAAKYNYLYVVNPIMTSFDAQIAYENLQKRMERKHYFVINTVMASPNTTMLELQPDIWTNYINDCEIPYFYLWRGHAPVAASDTDRYLANPRQNCDYLLTDDLQLDTPQNVAHSVMHPVNAGEPYLCIASTVTPGRIANISALDDSDANWNLSDITYSDRDIRWGYQQNVSGFEWGAQGAGRIGTSGTKLVDNTPSVSVYGIRLSNAVASMEHLEAHYPHFMRTIQAAFVLGADMIKLGTSRTLGSVTMYDVVGAGTSFDLKFTKDMFGYPKEYERFAKLYTSQYVTVEVSDNNHQTFNVKIEDTDGGLHSRIFSNVAFPLLNFTALFEGIGSSSTASYTWQGAQKSITYGDIANHMMKFNIPTYALYQSAVDDWNARNAYNNAGRRLSAIASYKNEVGLANETKADIDDTQDTQNANVQRTNATNVSNVAADMNKHVTNVGNAGDAAIANQNTNNAANTATRNQDSWSERDITRANAEKISNDMQSDVGASVAITAAENDAIATTTSNNAAAGVASGGVSMLTGFAESTAMAYDPALGSAIAPALSGGASFVNAGISAIAMNANASISQSTNDAIRTASAANATDKTHYAVSNGSEVNGYAQRAKNANVATMNDAALTTTTTTVNMHNTNAGNDRTTANANANRTANTSNANSAASTSTEKNNGQQDRLERVEAAKRNLESSRYPAYYEHMQARLDAPVQIGFNLGQDNGSEQATYHHMQMEGIQVRIKTAKNCHLRRVADYFARFGYNIEQVWEIKSLQVMKHFTYWRARDVWITDGTGTNGIAQIVIASIFKNGVTVWSNPEDIGKVSVYAN